MSERVHMAIRRKGVNAPEDAWVIQTVDMCNIPNAEGFKDVIATSGVENNGIATVVEYPCVGETRVHQITAESGKQAFRYLVVLPEKPAEHLVITFNMSADDQI